MLYLLYRELYAQFSIVHFPIYVTAATKFTRELFVTADTTVVRIELSAMISGEPQELPLNESFRSLKHSQTDFISDNILIFICCVFLRVFYYAKKSWNIRIVKTKNVFSRYLTPHLEIKETKLKRIFWGRFRFYILSYFCFSIMSVAHSSQLALFLAKQGTIDFLQLFLSGVSSRRAKCRRCNRLSTKWESYAASSSSHIRVS